MSRYQDYFLSDHSDVIEYETFEISHPDFSQVYYLVRNATDGMYAADEDGYWRTWQYAPMEIRPIGHTANLDFSIEIFLGDVGSILRAELKNVREADGMDEYPVVTYRTFASDTLGSPMQGPFILEMRQVGLERQGARFECRPPIVNRTRTGVPYTPERFPSLRGFM